MKKFFILEDDFGRALLLENKLKAAFPDCQIFIGSYLEAAYFHFEKHYPFDTIFLDHDLGNEDDLNENGYTFSKWLKSNFPIDNDQVIVHSMDNVGQKNIHDVLPNAQVIPISELLRIKLC